MCNLSAIIKEEGIEKGTALQLIRSVEKCAQTQGIPVEKACEIMGEDYENYCKAKEMLDD